MKKNSKIRKSTPANSTKTRFEDTEEGRRILSSLSESLRQIRMENEHNGEVRILSSFSKKNKTKFYTTPFEKDLDNMLLKRKAPNKSLKHSDYILSQVQRQQGMRIPPKN
jgi:hypothetical protein